MITLFEILMIIGIIGVFIEIIVMACLLYTTIKNNGKGNK